jgi:hypothetical protein
MKGSVFFFRNFGFSEIRKNEFKKTRDCRTAEMQFVFRFKKGSFKTKTTFFKLNKEKRNE